MAYKSLDSITAFDIESLGIAREDAARLHQVLKEIVATHGVDTPATWQSITKRILNPQLPFSFHQMLYYGCYKHYGPDPPAWIPDKYALHKTVSRVLSIQLCYFVGFDLLRYWQRKRFQVNFPAKQKRT